MNSRAAEVRVRRMAAADLHRVVEIERSLKEAPHWPMAAYLDALDSGAAVKRIALVAEVAWPSDGFPSEGFEEHPSGAKAHEFFADSMYGLKPVPFTESSSPQGLKPHSLFANLTARLKSCPFKTEKFHAQAKSSAASREGESGGIVGFAVTSLLGAQGELETIAVAAEGQRRGVGGRLMTAIIQDLRLAQVTEVTLEVRVSNGPALGLYAAQGFVEAGRRPRYYADPEEDAVLMVLRLK